jgi:hypothetical protein
MAAHRYWSVNVSAVQSGGTEIMLQSIQLFVSRGGASQCMGSGCSQQYVYGQAYQAFNGGAGPNPWDSDGTAPQWIGWYFGAQGAQSVYEFEITYSSFANYFAPATFDLDYSDNGTSWTTAASFTGVSWTSSETQTFATGVTSSHLYWRLNVTATVGGSIYPVEGISAIQLHATSGGANITQGTASASSVGTGELGEASGANPANCVMFTTNNFGTAGYSGWVSVSSVTSARWVYDFGSGVTPSVGVVSLTNTPAISLWPLNTGTSAFTLEHSDDGSTWTVQGSFSGITWAAINETQTFPPLQSGSQFMFAAE